jgi:ubiquinone/menaquinone biosynthesis C-methylase UbiE
MARHYQQRMEAALIATSQGRKRVPIVSARYDKIADFYTAKTGDAVTDAATSGLLDLLPHDLRGKRLLDLACGSGRISRVLARRNATVIGMDISVALLDKARASEHCDQLGITYIQGDVTAAQVLTGEVFDGVVCNHGLADIDTLDGVLATTERVLIDGGFFVFSLLHPCFPGWGPEAPSSWAPGTSYYKEGWWLAENQGFRGKVGSNHRMLSTYLNALVRHSLALDAVVEPSQPPEPATSEPDKDLVPVFLAVRCRRRRVGQ